MALTDFLNNGQLPTGSTFKSLTSETVLPDWYTNYAKPSPRNHCRRIKARA